MIESYLIWRKKAKQIWRETPIFGGIGGSVTVSSQFHIIPLKSNRHAKF